MRQLTTMWTDDPRTAEEIIANNPLASPSRNRLNDVLVRTFIPRFVKGNPENLWRVLAILEQGSVNASTIRAMHYFAAANSDLLLNEFTIEWLYEQYLSQRLQVDTDDVKSFLQARPVQKFGSKRWSESVQTKVARGLLAALRDFGILEGRSKKSIAPVDFRLEACALIAFILHGRFRGGEQVLAAIEWKLYMQSRADIEKAFLEAHARKYLNYQAAGNTISIFFPADTLEDYARVIIQRTN